MSRSGYSDDYDYDQWAMIRWRGAVTSAIRGARGQAMFRELLAALDGMEPKRLITGDLVKEGDVCALGALGVARGLSMDDIDPDDRKMVAGRFGIPEALAAEVLYVNDEWGCYGQTPEDRFRKMRQWVAEQIKPDTSADTQRS